MVTRKHASRKAGTGIFLLHVPVREARIDVHKTRKNKARENKAFKTRLAKTRLAKTRIAKSGLSKLWLVRPQHTVPGLHEVRFSHTTHPTMIPDLGHPKCERRMCSSLHDTIILASARQDFTSRSSKCLIWNAMAGAVRSMSGSGRRRRQQAERGFRSERFD
jgi:hypothetical protein